MPWETEDNHLLATVAENLEHLVTAARINLFYTEEGRRDLVAQYRQLAKVCVEARTGLQEAMPKDGLSWEERIRVVGEDEARRVTQPHSDTLATSHQATQAFDAFRKSHPLIGKLLMGSTAA